MQICVMDAAEIDLGPLTGVSCISAHAYRDRVVQ